MISLSFRLRPHPSDKTLFPGSGKGSSHHPQGQISVFPHPSLSLPVLEAVGFMAPSLESGVNRDCYLLLICQGQGELSVPCLRASHWAPFPTHETCHAIQSICILNRRDRRHIKTVHLPGLPEFLLPTHKPLSFRGKFPSKNRLKKSPSAVFLLSLLCDRMLQGHTKRGRFL